MCQKQDRKEHVPECNRIAALPQLVISIDALPTMNVGEIERVLAGICERHAVFWTARNPWGGKNFAFARAAGEHLYKTGGRRLMCEVLESFTCLCSGPQHVRNGDSRDLSDVWSGIGDYQS